MCNVIKVLPFHSVDRTDATYVNVLASDNVATTRQWFYSYLHAGSCFDNPTRVYFNHLQIAYAARGRPQYSTGQCNSTTTSSSSIEYLICTPVVAAESLYDVVLNRMYLF